MHRQVIKFFFKTHKKYFICSQPHFYNADPSLEKAIDGIKGDIEKHDTYLDIEPLTGITLSAHKRGQVRKKIY